MVMSGTRSDMGLFVNQGGSWTEVLQLFTHHEGNWVEVQEAFVNEGGVWKKYHSAAQEPITTFITETTLGYEPIGSVATFQIFGGGGGGGSCGDLENTITVGSGGGAGGEYVDVENYDVTGISIDIYIGAGGPGGSGLMQDGFDGDPTRVVFPGNVEETAGGGEAGTAGYGSTQGLGGQFAFAGGNGGNGVDRGLAGVPTMFAFGGEPVPGQTETTGGGGGGASYGTGGDGDGSDGIHGSGGGGQGGYDYELHSGGTGGNGLVIIISTEYREVEFKELPGVFYNYRGQWTKDGVTYANNIEDL